jgi:hypothetical protein
MKESTQHSNSTAGHTHSPTDKLKVDITSNLSKAIGFAIAGVLLAIPAIILFQVLMLLLDGFLFSTMWGWWIVPTFGLKPLTLIQAMGISVLIAYFRNFHYLKSQYSGKYEMWKVLLQGLVTDLIYFGISWLLLIWR